jgi:hypothetical protein
MWFILSILFILCFYNPEAPKLNAGMKLLQSSTGPMVYIGTSCLVSYIIISMILNLTVSVLAGVPVDVTDTLTETSAIPTAETILSQGQGVMTGNVPMTWYPSDLSVFDVVAWLTNSGITNVLEIYGGAETTKTYFLERTFYGRGYITNIPTITSTMRDTVTVTSTVTSVSTSTIIQPLTGALFGNNIWTGLIYLLTGLGSLTFNFLSSLLCGTQVGLGCVLSLTFASQFTQFMSNIGYAYLLSIPPVAVFSILLSIIIGAWTLVIILRPNGSSPIITALRRIADVIIKIMCDILCFLLLSMYYFISRIFR